MREYLASTDNVQHQREDHTDEDRRGDGEEEGEVTSLDIDITRQPAEPWDFVDEDYGRTDDDADAAEQDKQFAQPVEAVITAGLSAPTDALGRPRYQRLWEPVQNADKPEA